MPATQFGVVALGHALGAPRSVADTVAEFVDDGERVLRWGYHTYHRSPDRPLTDLAAAAATPALSRAGVDPKQIDMVVVANSDVPDYWQWDVSSAVARQLGVFLVPCALFTQGCAAGATALEYIAGCYATRDDLETVLLVAMNQVSEAHTNRMRFNTCLTSDGAAAAVFRRGHPRLRWLVSEQITDPKCADFFRLEYGGRAVPVGPDGRTNLDVDPLELVYEHFRRQPEHLDEFRYALTARVAMVVHRACDRVGLVPGQLAKLIYINDNQQSIAQVAKAVGLPLDRTNAGLAAALGHCGAADNLLDLDLYLEEGAVAEDDIVALVGMSSGMHWYCTLLQA